MKRVGLGLSIVLTLLGHAAIAQGVLTDLKLARACAGDVERLCKGVIPGEGRIKACIKEKLKELSSSCVDVLSGVIAEKIDTPGVEGAPGSPSATVTIDGKQLPAPPQKFEGKIEREAPKSTPYWPARIVPPKGAPNVLLIMTDDAGYGVASTFGGVIPTPALDRIASDGLRYTNFHSTALCSPTRAAIITGRNHHFVGYGVIAELATGYPGYNSFITKDKATVGRILLDNGYHTAWFGKNHNTPEFLASQAGPFDQWPTGMGFEYFYGFMGGDTNQWEPGNLVRNTTPIYPYLGKPGWNLVTAMADEAIGYMKRMNALSPDTPFFINFVPEASHAPHHPTPEWVKKISDMHLFDAGWNKLQAEPHRGRQHDVYL